MKKTIESVNRAFNYDQLSIGSAVRVYGALHPAAKLQIVFTSIRKVKHSIVIHWKGQQMTASACVAKLLQQPKIEYQHELQWCNVWIIHDHISRVKQAWASPILVSWWAVRLYMYIVHTLLIL